MLVSTTDDDMRRDKLRTCNEHENLMQTRFEFKRSCHILSLFLNCFEHLFLD